MSGVRGMLSITVGSQQLSTIHDVVVGIDEQRGRSDFSDALLKHRTDLGRRIGLSLPFTMVREVALVMQGLNTDWKGEYRSRRDAALVRKLAEQVTTYARIPAFRGLGAAGDHTYLSLPSWDRSWLPSDGSRVWLIPELKHWGRTTYTQWTSTLVRPSDQASVAHFEMLESFVLKAPA